MRADLLRFARLVLLHFSAPLEARADMVLAGPFSPMPGPAGGPQVEPTPLRTDGRVDAAPLDYG